MYGVIGSPPPPEELVEKMDSYDNLRIRKVQRESSHGNNKLYPKQPEYQRCDKKQNCSRVPKVEYGRGPNIRCDITYKISTTQNNRKPALSGVPSKSTWAIQSTWADSFLYDTIAVRLE
ncbi:hypothetical protein CDAR_564671 [Caerostris darwini]|uniref:Uncharacterized protein n=1 Tax=Caerostris darwini TaxID=1538125 RepID=A0AAV4THZ6_9ARAC|nr:hypothetical protein CDAR_564671 [Caerostris darwini]